jgi:hypothetical protein
MVVLFLVCSLAIRLFGCGIADFRHVLYMVPCSLVVDVDVNVHSDLKKSPQEI